MSKEFNITLLPGDGTGPEVVNEAVKVLENTSEQYKIKFNFTSSEFLYSRKQIVGSVNIYI